MKARQSIKAILSSILGMLFLTFPIFAQDEYDDMYFNQKDRKKVNYEVEKIYKSNSQSDLNDQTIAKNNIAEPINASYSPKEYGDINENYSSKNVNPEYIGRYKSNPKDNIEASEYGTDESYYVENFDREEFEDETAIESATNKYSYPSAFDTYSPYMGYNSMARMDPFWGHSAMRPRFSMGFGYGMGSYSRMSMNMGYGMGYPGYYDPWMMAYNNPYMYNPYGFYGPGYMDPWMNPYGGGSHYGVYSSMFGYNRYNANNCYYGSNSSWTSSVDISPKKKYKQRVARGADSQIANTQNTETRRATATRSRAQLVNESSALTNARTTRDYSKVQNEYYNQSRSRSGNTRSSRSTVNSGSSGRSSAITTSSRSGVRSTRTNMDYSRPSYKSTRQSQSSVGNNSGRRTSTSYSGSRSSSGKSSFSSPRSSGSSYRSSGRSSSGSSSGGSRSSGGSSGGGSRSGGRGN